MAITLGAEVALSLHLTTQKTYGEVEDALLDVGFDDYSIMRSVNPDGSADIQLYVRNAADINGQREMLPAADTMAKLADALGALEDTDPAPTPPEPDPEPPTE